MYPLLFGGHNTYLVTLALMAVFPVAFVASSLRREGVSAHSVAWAVAWLLLAAILGGKLFSLATRGWPAPLWGSGELSGGMRFSGVVIAVLLVLPVLQRRLLAPMTLARTADILAMTLAVAVCSGRVACLLVGCCTGGRGDSLLHLSYPPGSAIWYQHLQSGVIESGRQWSEPVLALPILFFCASLVAVIFLLRYDPRRRYDGQICLLFLLLHELPKFFLELLRDPLIPGQLAAAAAAGTVGLLGLLYCRFYPPVSSRQLPRRAF